MQRIEIERLQKKNSECHLYKLHQSWYYGATLVCLLVLTLLASAGCTALAPEIEQTPVIDATAQTTVKSALINALGTNAAAISVEANDGVITLSGFVESDQIRNKALASTRSSQPSATIIDKLQVR